MKVQLMALSCALILAASLAAPVSAHPSATARVAQSSAQSSSPGFGPLHLGMGEDEVEQAIGEASTRYEPEIDEVTGQHIHTTGYSNGVTLTFLDNPQVAQPGTLMAIILDENCDWQGMGGLKVGLEASQARALVAEMIDSGAQPLHSGTEDEASVHLPNSQTLLMVRFKRERVDAIYLGPELGQDQP